MQYNKYYMVHWKSEQREKDKLCYWTEIRYQQLSNFYSFMFPPKAEKLPEKHTCDQ